MLALEGHIEANGGSVVLRCPVERIERDAGGPVPADDRRRQPRRHHLRRTSCCSAGLHASKLARTLSLRRRLHRPRPTTPRANTTRCRAARRSSATSTRCPTAPGSACTPRSTSAGAASSAPTSSGSPGIDYSFQPEKLEKFLDFIRSYYPGLEVERLHPDYTGVRPKLYREGEPVPDFAIHGPATHGVAGPRRPLRHREPGADGLARHRRGGGGDAAAAVVGRHRR